MSFKNPYRYHNYMGEHADDAACLTWLQLNKFDSNKDGTGSPENGMFYYKTTGGGNIRLYQGGTWIDWTSVGAGSPGTILVSSGDTTPDYLSNKLTVSDGSNTSNILEATIQGTGDEDFQIQIDESKIDHDNLISTTPNPHTVTLEQARTAGNTISGNIDAQGNTIMDVGWAADKRDVTTQEYVDAVSGFQAPVLDRYDPTGGLPVGPSDGDRYLATATANGWTQHYIYHWCDAESAWRWAAPYSGMAVWVVDESIFMYYDSSVAAWAEFEAALSHDLLGHISGGATGQYYHLTSTQHGDLTDVGGVGDGGSQHHHDGRYFTESELGAITSPSGGSLIGLDTGNFDGILSGTEDEVQAALDVLDDHTHTFLDLSDTPASYSGYDGRSLVVNEISGIIFSSGISADDLYKETMEPTGFPNRTDSVISFTDGLFTFTIAPSGAQFSYFIQGIKYTKTVAQNVVITDTEGLWVFYFDGATLTASQTIPVDLLYAKAFVAFIYWDAANDTAIILGDERHGMTMDWATHTYLHETVWTRYESGLTLTPLNALPQTGSTLGDGQVNMTGGTIHDEDIIIDIVHSNTPSNPFEQDLDGPAQIPVYYRSGATGDWRKLTTGDYPFSSGVDRMNYNQWTGATWQLTEATNNYHVAIWIIATNNISEPIIALVGQRQDNAYNDALNNNTLNSIVWGTVPFKEMKPLYRIIAKTATGYTYDAAFLHILDLRSVSSVPGAGYVSTSHNSLSGRSDDNAHPATSISADTTNFNNALSAADDTVQKALDTLDNFASGVDLGQTWEFDSTVTDADPGSGKFRLNNATQSSATYIYVSKDAASGVDMGHIFNTLVTGDFIYMQESADAPRYHLWSVSGTVVDATTYWKIPISNDNSGSDLVTGNMVGWIIFFAAPVTASEVTVSTTGFGGILSGSDTTVQLALDTIDDHSHSNSIHDDVAGEINAITEKTAMANDDVILIEDSAAAYVKKKVKYSTLGVKQEFFGCAGAFYGNYRVMTIASNDQGRFSFSIPPDFSSLVSMVIVLIPGGSVAGVDIDIYTNYAAIGEGYTTHAQSDTASTYTFTADQMSSINVAPLFTNIAAGDLCGIQVDHNSIGISGYYLGVRMVYR